MYLMNVMNYMEKKRILMVDAIICRKDQLEEMQPELKRYKSVEVFNHDLWRRCEYQDMTRKIRSNEIVIIGKRVNGFSKTTSKELIEKICANFGVTFKEAIKKDRHREFVNVRQLIHYILYKSSRKGIIPILSLNEIGKLTIRNHATVLHSIHCVEKFYETEPGYRIMLDGLIDTLDIDI
jgi:hypothetical protein